MNSKIEIIFHNEKGYRERVISVDGIEKFRDKKALEMAICDDDPIRRLELFQLGICDDNKPNILQQRLSRL